MIPVKQQFLHDPANGSYGDCQRAVIASILEMPIEKVPHFNEKAKEDPSIFFESIQEFLAPLGLMWITMHSFDGPMMAFGTDHNIYHEIAGTSPRNGNVLHAVVGCNGKIVHDPHPDNQGLAGDPSTWTFSFAIPKPDHYGKMN